MTRQKQRYTVSFKKEVLGYWQSTDEAAKVVAKHNFIKKVIIL